MTLSDACSLEGSGRTPVYVQSIDTTNHFDVKELGGFYQKYLSDGWVVDGSVRFCGSKWLKFWCEKGGHYLVKPQYCNVRRFCPTCARRYRRLKVGHAIGTFKKLRTLYSCNVYLTHVVVTFPRELWSEVAGNIDRAFKLVYRLFDYPFGGVSGGVVALHLWHSGSPLSGLYPHFHVIVPNVVLKKEGRFSYLVRVRPFFNVEWFKARFKDALLKSYCFRAGEVNVYFAYSKLDNEVRSRHILNYAFRLPIEDFAPYLNEGVSEREAEFVKFVLKYNGHRIRWFGFLADGVKSKYVKYVRFDKWMKDYLDLCPIHGSKLVLVETFLDRPPPDAICICAI